MPLPAALAARLAKRGLVKEEQKRPRNSDEVEEIFAEDYDDLNNVEVQDNVPHPVAVPQIEQPFTDPVIEDLVFECINCPNKWNVHHKCADYCKTKYSIKSFEAQVNMAKRRERHLRKYPLPVGWSEVGDPDTGRYYYWSVATDQVSWLSPIHPEAQITLPADRLQAMFDSSTRFEAQQHINVNEKAEEESDLSDLSSSDSSSEDEKEHRPGRKQEREPDKREPDKPNPEKREQDKRKPKGNDKRGAKRSREDTLDPMDPASYSDIPRGNWSDGLDQRGKAKTGVDSTAAGPLFQQRPYPSPGDVLRANKQMTDK